MIIISELGTREKKIIDDILFHLDGWRLNNHPKETRRIESFLDEDEPHFNNQIRKEVSSREVLTAYDKGKIHALNYIKRKEFPNNPAIYQAICYWAAGLLSEKAHFREDKTNESQMLIEEARRILEPHVKKSQDFFTVSGDDWMWEEWLRSETVPRPRRNRIPPKEGDDEEPKEPLTHGHFHEQFHYRPPRKSRDPCPSRYKYTSDDRFGVDRDWIATRKKRKYEIKTEPIISEDGEKALIKSRITLNGRPCMSGKLMYYVYIDD